MDAAVAEATKEAEEGVIGSLFVRPDLMQAVIDVPLEARMFQGEGLRKIFHAMLDLHAAGQELEVKAVLSLYAIQGGTDLEVRNAVVACAENVPTGVNAVWYARNVRSFWRKRRTAELEAELDSLRKRGAGSECIAKASAALTEWMAATATEESGRELATNMDAMQEFINRVRRGDERLMPLGIDDLDRAIGGGVGYGEFVVFAAMSNHCKSSLALHAIHDRSAHGTPCLVLSAEMSKELLGKRTLQTMLDGMSEHDYERNLPALEKAAASYARSHEPWYVDDKVTSIAEVLASIDMAVKRYGVKFVALDYLQMIECRGGNKLEAVSKVSSMLRDKAKEHKIVILALCQMNNNITKRPKFQPKISDIEYGPQIFKDADLVIFGVWPHRVDETQPSDKYDFYVAKSRNRAILRSVLTVNWHAPTQTFQSATSRDGKRGPYDFSMPNDPDPDFT